MSANMKIMLGLPVLFIIMSLLTIKIIRFNYSLSKTEARLLKFTPEKTGIDERPPFTFYTGLKSPIEIRKTPAKGFPSVPLSEVAPQVTEKVREIPIESKVSMIVIAAGRRIAVINGMVVREGDPVGSLQVKRIEKDRILLSVYGEKDSGQGARWVYLEEKR